MIYLRFAKEEDKSLVLAWRNHPENYNGFYSQKGCIPWEEHDKWWKSRPSSWREYIIMLCENGEIRPVGVLTLGQTEYWEPEIGICIGNPMDWGKGYAKEALLLALGVINGIGWKHSRTTILDSNTRSIKLFEHLGYKRVGEARLGESLYRKAL